MFRQFLKEIHWPILFLALLLTSMGIMAIYSASFRGGDAHAAKQFFWFLVGLGVFFATIWIGYRSFLNISYVLYAVGLSMLLWVLVFGETHAGAQRWISIGSFQLQPSELAKMATILMLSKFLSDQSPFLVQKRTLLAAIIFTSVPAFLVLKQPDLGTALVFLPILFGMIFLWGVRVRYLVGLSVVAILSLPFLWSALKPYQQKRLLVFLNPSIDPIGASYTAIQSKIAVGSGGLFGKGWLEGTQTQLDFVPEHHTDFIFTVLSEEFGFLGSLFLILVFMALAVYVFRIIYQTTDLRARLLALGVISYFIFQIFVNMGMTIGLAPITGITLPFISYGGSSLVINFFAFGLLVSIYKERSIF